MTGKTNAISDVIDDQSQNVTLKIWSKTGAIFQEIFPINQTTFAHVKYLAMKFLLKNSNLDETDNYKLISIESKKSIDEQKTLRQESVKDGDEYLLAIKISIQSTKTSESCPIDEKLIQIRTKDLPISAHLFRRAHRLTRRMEFWADLNRILLTLIETSQKLLWYRSDAEQIFKQAEKILSKSPTKQLDDIEIDSSQIRKLIDMGFTQQQAQIALKRTRSDLNAAMELLLTQPDIDENENENEVKPSTTFYSHNDSFIPFRQFRQQYFQPNPIAIQSLEEMGFNHNDIIDALRIFHNDQNLSCDYLLGNKQQQQNTIDAHNEQGLDPNSNLFKVIMENPFVQRAVNNPKIFFVMIQLYENPDLVTNFLSDPEIGTMLLQISRIYHTERYQMDTSNSNQRDLQNDEN